MRMRIVGAWLVAFAGLGIARAEAAPLLDLSGKVALLDGATPEGVRVALGLDLDRDGKFSSFEMLNASVGPDGSFRVEYSPDPTQVDFDFIRFVTRLAADFRARGFDAVLADGPLPVVVRFEREGYSTIVKRFTTLTDTPSLEVTLEALSSLGCTSTSCLTPDGRLSLSGFPAGSKVARAFARAYDPAEDGGLFPGSFSDSNDNLLISSGFAEINLHDSAGKPITSVSSPVSVRMEARPASWASLRDLQPDSGRIEVPMYSFDESIADWVAEEDGELQREDGTAIEEEQFASIQDGSYAGPVYIAFKTSHFSTFNCDAPVRERACVRGRIVNEGKALQGAQVIVEGASYTGNAGMVVTGADGSFATDVMRSEGAGEDFDGNRRAGETFRARVTARSAAHFFRGAPFDTPNSAGTATPRTGTRCQPSQCRCLDLGDIEVDFDLPRRCELTVEVRASGKTAAGVQGGPLAAGAALASASVTGRLAGEWWAAQLDPSECRDVPCSSTTADAKGSATLVVPVIGDAPQIELNVRHRLNNAQGSHYYEQRLVLAGCEKGQVALDVPVQLEIPHATLRETVPMTGASGAPSSQHGRGGENGWSNPANGGEEQNTRPRSCNCGIPGAPGSGSAIAAAVTLLGLALRRRRR